MVKIAIKYRENKSETIIKAAQKRFGLYGLEKTSMREIADDLRISKAALYYYFPDKESLYKTVISKEQEEFLRILENDVNSISDPVDCLRKYALTRLSYFRRLINLSRIRLASLSDLKPKIADSLRDFAEDEKHIVAGILERGKRQNIFIIDDTYTTATLFLDLLRGLRNAFMTNKDILVMDETEFRILTDKVNEITEIFIKGLMYK
jgi:AcrR family transcriptional regulator